MSTLKPDTASDPFKPEVPVEPIRRQMHELESGLTLRIEELARENRRLRRLWMGTVVSGALLLGLATALVIVTAQHGLPGTIANVIEAKQFVLRDGQGNIRGSWSTSENGSMRLSLQAPKSKAGLSLAALADGASGITVRDSAGRSRAVVGLLPDQTVSLLFADENGPGWLLHPGLRRSKRRCQSRDGGGRKGPEHPDLARAPREPHGIVHT